MKVGILGTGFGRFHASIYKGLTNIDSIIIYGSNTEKLDSIKKEMDIEVTSNINDIMNNKDIDLVDVCLPSSVHREYVIQSLKSGKDIFCETPVSLSLEDAIAMKETQDQYGKRVFVNLFIKHEPPYQYLYETVQNNTYGKLKALSIRRKTPPLWGDLGLGKITTNLMIHEFDFITWLLGIPDSISAAGVPGKEGQSHVDALLRYKDTIVAVQGSSMMPSYHPFTVGYEAVFEEGTVEYLENGYAHGEEKSLIAYTNNGKSEIEIKQKNCYEESIKHVIECIQHNTHTILGIDDAVRSLNVAVQIQELITKG